MPLPLPFLSLGSTNLIREGWDRLSPLPAGKALFSRALGLGVPYSGTLGASVETLSRGRCELSFEERRSVRNHLGSVHAIALANAAELAGNLALIYSLPDDARFIVAALSIEYLKKAHGTIRAVGEAPVPATNERREYVVTARLYDPGGDEVARATLRSLVGPKKPTTPR